MGKYYRGRRAQHYNARWRTYSERTLAETLAMIDVSALRSVSERLGRFPRLQETFDLITCTNALHDLVLFPSRDAPIIRPSMPNLYPVGGVSHLIIIIVLSVEIWQGK